MCMLHTLFRVPIMHMKYILLKAISTIMSCALETGRRKKDVDHSAKEIDSVVFKS